MNSQRPKPPFDEPELPSPPSSTPNSVRRPVQHRALTCDEPFMEYRMDQGAGDEPYSVFSFQTANPAPTNPPRAVAGQPTANGAESGTFAVIDAQAETPAPRARVASGTFHGVQSLPQERLHGILDVFDDFMGYAFDAARVIRDLGYHRDQLPVSLAPLLIVELSKRLHPARRQDFLRAACPYVFQESAPANTCEVTA